MSGAHVSPPQHRNEMTLGAYYFDGQWYDESPRIVGPMSHALWMSSVVFDGARAIGGFVPDLELHCERLVRSADAMHLAATLSAGEIADLCRDGVRRLPRDKDYYIRPAFYAEEGFINPVPESTYFVLAIFEAPLPKFRGFSACLSSRRRPARDMAPTDAKAACLYPNGARALREAEKRGYDNAIICDPNGNVAEFATANLWIAKDGVAYTPIENGTFLPGVTRLRVAELLRAAGTEVVEQTIDFDDVLAADEIFSTGNYQKVAPVVRVEDRDLQPGPLARKAYDLYLDYTKGFDVF